jgi:hypothetical protein
MDFFLYADYDTSHYNAEKKGLSSLLRSGRENEILRLPLKFEGQMEGPVFSDLIRGNPNLSHSRVSKCSPPPIPTRSSAGLVCLIRSWGGAESRNCSDGIVFH